MIITILFIYNLISIFEIIIIIILFIYQFLGNKKNSFYVK